VLKLTRLNRLPVAVNPDHISWIDIVPDTTICLISGDKLLVRETLDELIEQLIAFRRLIRAYPAAREVAEADLPPIDQSRYLRRTPQRGQSSFPPPASGTPSVRGRDDGGRGGT